jgi:hypothetical protein
MSLWTVPASPDWYKSARAGRRKINPNSAEKYSANLPLSGGRRLRQSSVHGLLKQQPRRKLNLA